MQATCLGHVPTVFCKLGFLGTLRRFDHLGGRGCLLQQRGSLQGSDGGNIFPLCCCCPDLRTWALPTEALGSGTLTMRAAV